MCEHAAVAYTSKYTSTSMQPHKVSHHFHALLCTLHQAVGDVNFPSDVLKLSRQLAKMYAATTGNITGHVSWILCTLSQGNPVEFLESLGSKLSRMCSGKKPKASYIHRMYFVWNQNSCAVRRDTCKVSTSASHVLIPVGFLSIGPSPHLGAEGTENRARIPPVSQ